MKTRGLVEENDILSDLYHLQCFPTKKIFVTASELFVKKWKERKVQITIAKPKKRESQEHSDSQTNKKGPKQKVDFADFFADNYLKKANKWAEAFSSGHCPSTNNGLESTNAAIKEHKTLRERLATNVFWLK